jgi:hypothetical protein
MAPSCSRDRVLGTVIGFRHVRASETSRRLFPHSGFVHLQIAKSCPQYWNCEPMLIGPAHEIANYMLALSATPCLEVIED